MLFITYLYDLNAKNARIFKKFDFFRKTLACYYLIKQTERGKNKRLMKMLILEDSALRIEIFKKQLGQKHDLYIYDQVENAKNAIDHSGPFDMMQAVLPNAQQIMFEDLFDY